MPTYAYACTECDHTFETVQSFSDDALSVCPQCHGRLRKVFNAVGVVFKGSGFYRTDSREKSKQRSSSTASTSESGSSSGAPSSSSSDGSSKSGSTGGSSNGSSSTGSTSSKPASTTSV